LSEGQLPATAADTPTSVDPAVMPAKIMCLMNIRPLATGWNIVRVGTPWMWTLAFGQHEDRTPTHGYAATRKAAMTAFAKSWRRE
jgi:hypothetical protein